MTRFSAFRFVYAVGWRERRGVLMAYLALLAADVVAIGGFGLALRALIGAAMSHDSTACVLAALVASLGWAMTAVGGSIRTNLIMLLAEHGGTCLDERTLRAAGRVQGLADLESAEYADRVALLRGGADLAATYAWRLLDLGTTLLRLAVVLSLLVVVAPAMTLLLAALVPVLWLQRRGQAGVARAVAASGSDTRLAEHLHALLTEPGPGMEIRVAGAELWLRELARDAWFRLIHRQEKARYAAAGLVAAGWAAFTAVSLGALLVTVDAIASGRARPADALVAVMLTLSLCVQAENAMTTIQRHAHGMHYLDALIALEAQPGRAPHGAAALVPGELRDAIVLDDVAFCYPGAKLPILRGIDLRLAAGTTVAVVGEHGAGKTTLVKLLCGLYEPTGGTVTVDGQSLGAISAHDWWSRVTVAFQDYARYAFVVREAVGCGDPAALDDLGRVRLAVAHGAATGVVEALPQGLDTQLGESFGGVELSGGQWQRIALSRAFMRRDPLLFVLDEPTASLDARSEHELYERHMAQAKQLAREWGTVTVVISHRFSTVRAADHIVVLAEGHIAEQGSHTDLMDRDGMYAELYRLQAAGYLPDATPARIPSGARREEG
ncbi:ATP-binding cassette domain-containing protein [Streptomyces sp. NPDC002763]|uniref:ABC transporter ATP-binding protein n=1 Tax=Streptomyces sp. NPDC002763 TaxID=3154427 RepID=UPI00332C368E